ncbi:hypothetical protein B0H17DRAFT_1220592 [Mycena rosella]|uniref:Uncharacterized protein n=1 Tax=Mycena rosella TaxID=1033263 RepID=A0AAD7B8V7_MYCRO|nr:hypothetical protein B0H17DRAFT_1220592 [Mycena rosella]
MSSGNTHSNKHFEVIPELKKRWGAFTRKHEAEKASPESIAKARRCVVAAPQPALSTALFPSTRVRTFEEPSLMTSIPASPGGLSAEVLAMGCTTQTAQAALNRFAAHEVLQGFDGRKDVRKGWQKVCYHMHAWCTPRLASTGHRGCMFPLTKPVATRSTETGAANITSGGAIRVKDEFKTKRDVKPKVAEHDIKPKLKQRDVMPKLELEATICFDSKQKRATRTSPPSPPPVTKSGDEMPPPVLCPAVMQDEDFYMEGDDIPLWYSLGAHIDRSLDGSTGPPSSISLSHSSLFSFTRPQNTAVCTNSVNPATVASAPCTRAPTVPASARPTTAARGLPTASLSASTNRAAVPATASSSAASTQQHGFYVIERTRVLHNDRAAAMAMAGGNGFRIFLQLEDAIEAAVIQA